MATVQVRTQSETSDFEAYPADTYYARIREADITESKFKDKDGNAQFQLALVWEVSRLTAEQTEAELEPGKWFRQWISLYYGETKNGPSKLKLFIDNLQGQGLLEEFDPAERIIDSDWFVGIEQRVSVDLKNGYNNVIGVAPLKLKKAAPAAAKNAPVHVKQAAPAKGAAVAEADEDDDPLF
jgi:hypothetical protein